MVRYTLSVKTGDRWLSGTNANVFIILHGRDGKHSDTFKLNSLLDWHFKRGKTDIFTIQCENLDEIAMIELWHGISIFGSYWYVESVNVVNQATQAEFMFLIRRWIKANYHYKVARPCLPADDLAAEQREINLLEKRNVYEFTDEPGHIPFQVKSMPPDEDFSFDYIKDIAKLNSELTLVDEFIMLTGGDWKSLPDLRNVYTKNILYEPWGKICWDNDVMFGHQRIAGVNPSLIELCRKIPENLGVTDEMLRPFLEGRTLEEAIAASKLFVCDLKLLAGIQPSKGLRMCAPIALSLVNGCHKLVPIAIQLYQKKGPNNPVFLPTDSPYTWMVAKMWYNNAESAYHESLTHLGFTHLMMEGIAVITHRNLSQFHPLFCLLVPHFLDLFPINNLIKGTLLSQDGYVNKAMNIGVAGMLELVARGLDMWRMNVHGTLPKDLEDRGVYNENVLPGYHFRDDALLLYDAIKTYVSEYVRLYYDFPEKITGDLELQSWRKDMIKQRENGGCGLQGVPGENGRFTEVDQIIQTLTCIIYTCSVGHAATNFPQYDEYAYPPNYPSLMRGEPPSSKETLTEQAVIQYLPDKRTTLDIMKITRILIQHETKSLGNFEVQYIFEPKAVKIVERFKEELKKISTEIKRRNTMRNPPYPFLDPENVPNSVSI